MRVSCNEWFYFRILDFNVLVVAVKFTAFIIIIYLFIYFTFIA